MSAALRPTDPGRGTGPVGGSVLLARLRDPAIALRWLGRARRVVIAVQALIMLVAEVGTTLHLHSPALIGILVALVVVEVVESWWLRRATPPPWAPSVHAAFDLLAVTVLLGLSGGPHNPLELVYLAYLALLAIVLPPRLAWSAAFAAMVLQTLVVLHPGDLPDLAREPLPTGHLVVHVVAFALAAGSITWFVSQLSAALNEREAAEFEAQQRRAITDRLAALGTLAAGVAHELATPLGTIQLLAEEAARTAPADLAPRLRLLVEQVDTCRALLDRLRGRDASGPGECRPEVGLWVTEWRRAAPEMAVDLARDAGGLRVAGNEESWRGAVWVALDNARRAGARHVVVDVSARADVMEVRVEDDGVGLSREDATRAGEPFRTTWGGTGLGLFVARTFAQSVGGDVLLEPAVGHGARARILMPRVGS